MTAPARVVPWQARFLLLALIWGSSFLLMKFGLRGFTPVQIAALRIFSGAATVLVLLRLTGGRLPRGVRTWAHLGVGGIFLTALPFTFFALSETRVSSALAGIGNSFTSIATGTSSATSRTSPAPEPSAPQRCNATGRLGDGGASASIARSLPPPSGRSTDPRGLPCARSSRKRGAASAQTPARWRDRWKRRSTSGSARTPT